MDYSSPPGLYDISPNDAKETWRSSHLWQLIESTVRKLCRDYGYEEVRTPIFEKSNLFLRSSGLESDIVSKELYRFEDKGSRDLSLRPEGTAPVLRSYNSWSQERQKIHQKLFYIGPMFRYDRPQAGRYRQHTQFGVEAIGSSSPEQDVEVIDLLYSLYQRLGIDNVTFLINSLGTKEQRGQFQNALIDYYTPLKDALSQDSQRRLQTNPLRILDSKEEKDIKINEKAPSILEFLDSSSKEQFQEVLSWLDRLKIPYLVTPHLVRGLDYYSGIVFEAVTNKLGAQNSIGAGGRYDGLIKELGGQDLPATGFGTGLERIIQTLIASGKEPKMSGPTLYLIALGDESKEGCYLLGHKLRSLGISTSVDLSGRKLNKTMQRAHASNARYVVILGSNEIEKGEIKLKEMASGAEITLPIDELAQYLLLEGELPELSQHWNRLSANLTSGALKQLFLNRLSDQIEATKRSVDSIAGTLSDLLSNMGKE